MPSDTSSRVTSPLGPEVALVKEALLASIEELRRLTAYDYMPSVLDGALASVRSHQKQYAAKVLEMQIRGTER